MSDTSDVQSWIDQTVKNNDVVLFMKGTKDVPQCGFSDRVRRTQTAAAERGLRDVDGAALAVLRDSGAGSEEGSSARARKEARPVAGWSRSRSVGVPAASAVGRSTPEPGRASSGRPVERRGPLSRRSCGSSAFKS